MISIKQCANGQKLKCFASWTVTTKQGWHIKSKEHISSDMPFNERLKLSPSLPLTVEQYRWRDNSLKMVIARADMGQFNSRIESNSNIVYFI